MVIRSEQISVMGEAMAERFDDELIRHLSSYAPIEAEGLGPDALKSLVVLARQRASEIGFTHRNAIRLYLDLMVLLGSGFATDPQHPWVAAALERGGELREQGERVESLHASALQYMHVVLGKKREFLSAALEQVVQSTPQEWQEAGDFRHSVSWQMRLMFPEKCSHLGQDLLRCVIDLAARRAEHHAMYTGPGITLWTILILLLGHEADSDPTAWWLEEALGDSEGSAPRQRVEKVHAATCAHIRLLLASRRTQRGVV